VFLREVAELGRVSYDALLKELSRQGSQPQRLPAPEPEESWSPKGFEKDLARLLIRWPDIRPVIFERWTPEGVADARLKELLGTLYSESRQGLLREADSLLILFPESPLRDFISGAMGTEENTGGGPKQKEIELRMALDCVRSMELDRIRVQLTSLQEQVSAAPEVLPEIQRLRREEQRLKAERKT
jgi:hypothetical protein